MKCKVTVDTSHYPKQVPFEVPQGWAWCRLGDIAYVAAGSTPDKSCFVPKGIPYIKMYNVRNQQIDFEYSPQYIIPSVHYGKLQRSILYPGDLLMNIVGPPLGKLAIIPDSLPESNTNQAAVLIRPFLHKSLINKYLFYYLEEMTEINSIATKGSAGQVNISLTQSQLMRIPLPPLEEQRKIVESIEKWMGLVDDVTNGVKSILDNSENAKAKILELAIHGKLVPQDPSDEPALELLRRINPAFQPSDNLHYEDCPIGWQVVTLKEIVSLYSGRDLEAARCNAEHRGIPYLVGASCINNQNLSVYRWTENPEVVAKINDTLLSCKGTVGEVILNQLGDVHIARQFMSIRSKSPQLILPKYIELIIKASIEKLRSTARGIIPGISREDILEMTVAIPPLAEQKRILTRISELESSLSFISLSIRN